MISYSEQRSGEKRCSLEVENRAEMVRYSARLFRLPDMAAQSLSTLLSPIKAGRRLHQLSRLLDMEVFLKESTGMAMRWLVQPSFSEGVTRSSIESPKVLVIIRRGIGSKH